MRRLIIAEFISLDGVIQAPGGPEEDTSGGFKFGGWIVPLDDDAIGEAIQALYSKPYDLLLGRHTYDIWDSHWGAIARDPKGLGRSQGEVKMAKDFEGVNKYVATHQTEPLKWKNSETLGPDPVEKVSDLKNSGDKNLLLQGSSELAHLLLSHGLVDELRLYIFPLVLGKGKRLFAEGSVPATFKLSHHKIGSTGTILTTYTKAGKVETGSFV